MALAMPTGVFSAVSLGNDSFVLKDYGDTNFVTGMRAFAAFAVVMTHAGGAGLRAFGETGNTLADLGRAGVYVFFVISGFSVASSYTGSAGYFSYLKKRLWRLAPLYYFWLTVCVLFPLGNTYWSQRFGAENDLYNILMHISFLSWLDYRITDAILGVEWSISIEVFWYLLVPGILYYAQDKRSIGLLLGGSLLLYALSLHAWRFLPLSREDARLAVQWSPFPYAFAYCLGVAVYRYRQAHRLDAQRGDLAMIVSLLLLVCYVVQPPIIKYIMPKEFIFVSLLTAGLIAWGSPQSTLFRCIFANRLVQFLGVISYGIYLCHLPVLSFLSSQGWLASTNETVLFAELCAAAIIISTATYYLVEQPGNRLGRRSTTLRTS